MARNKEKRPSPVPEGGWPTGRKVVQPSGEAVAGAEKKVRSLNVNDDEVKSRRLVWRFADLDDGGPWGLSSCASEELQDIFQKLKSYEEQTVGEVFAPGSQHGKKYPQDALIKEARERLLELRKDDETQLVRLRFAGRRRFFGILREHVFHVLWWDPEHDIVPSTKRNT